MGRVEPWDKIGFVNAGTLRKAKVLSEDDIAKWYDIAIKDEDWNEFKQEYCKFGERQVEHDNCHISKFSKQQNNVFFLARDFQSNKTSEAIAYVTFQDNQAGILEQRKRVAYVVNSNDFGDMVCVCQYYN
jgi:hypothetical protein